MNNDNPNETVYALFPLGAFWYKTTRFGRPLSKDFESFWKLLVPNVLLGCSYLSDEKELSKEFEELTASTPCVLLVDRMKKTAAKITKKNYFRKNK